MPGQRRGGAPAPGYGVDPHEDAHERRGEDERREHRVPHPVEPVELPVEPRADEAADEARERVQHDHGRQDGPALGRPEARDSAEEQQERGAASWLPAPTSAAKRLVCSGSGRRHRG